MTIVMNRRCDLDLHLTHRRCGGAELSEARSGPPPSVWRVCAVLACDGCVHVVGVHTFEAAEASGRCVCERGGTHLTRICHPP